MLVFENAVLNLSLWLKYVDWNKGTFTQAGDRIYHEVWAIVPAISFQPTGQTVIRFHCRHKQQRDLLGNPPSKTGTIQFGISTYF
jgi:hypothetical protein